jgi:hypothetical protein
MWRFLKKFFLVLLIMVIIIFTWAALAHFFLANTMIAPTLTSALKAGAYAVAAKTPLGLLSSAHFASGLLATGVLGASVGALSYAESQAERKLKLQTASAQAQLTNQALRAGMTPEKDDNSAEFIYKEAYV